MMVVACYFICRDHPQRIWYAPLICNAVGILAAFGEENYYWGSTLWTIITGGWILSVIVALWAAYGGRKDAVD
jgi:hypothetical protein